MTTLAAALVSLLIDVARAIGRWVVRRLVNLGIRKGLTWMYRKINTFKARRNRAMNRGWMLRSQWLAGKIARWMAAAQKIEKNQTKLEDKAVRVYCKATDTALAKVPWYAKGESCPANVLAESPIGLRGKAA